MGTVLPKKKIEKIIELRIDGWKKQTIARKLHIPRNTVKKYCKLGDMLASGDAYEMGEAVEELNKLYFMSEGVNEKPLKNNGREKITKRIEVIKNFDLKKIKKILNFIN